MYHCKSPVSHEVMALLRAYVPEKIALISNNWSEFMLILAGIISCYLQRHSQAYVE